MLSLHTHVPFRKNLGTRLVISYYQSHSHTFPICEQGLGIRLEGSATACYVLIHYVQHVMLTY